ncbi:MAG: hemerythrin family protein [Candidatus Hydrogenedentes bacterium]|nr:hemerythrin family protein [Candidatus Hydrogenedentota bacterium]
MAAIEWTNDLSVQVDVIDEQHKMLIKHLGDFATAVASHQGPGAIISTLDFLIEYTNFHFEEEEKHMKRSSYSGLEQQISQHEAFKKTLADMESDFKEDGATHELAGDIHTLLVNWLVTHIKTVDVEFGKFLAENGIIIRNEI